MGQPAEQIKDRIFSFPDMKLGLSPIASTSGKNNTVVFVKALFNWLCI